MLSIYRVGYIFYRILLTLTSTFHPKAKKWVEGRTKIEHDLQGIKGQSVLWFHAASLGEYEMGRPTLLRMKEQYPDKKILVTFFSPSGYENRKNDSALDFACYLPHDQPRSVERFLNLVEPEIAVFIKYEFWPCILRACIKRNIPLSVVSATFRERQFLFTNLGAPLRKLLHQFTAISVQDRKSEELLKHKGFTNVFRTGDGRFDNVSHIVQTEFTHSALASFSKLNPTLFGGSIWKEDEDVLLPQILRNPHLNFVLAPHEVDVQNIDRLMKRMPVPAIRLSECTSKTELDDYKVLVIDSIGILSKAYRYAKFAFVGGGFKTGLHNILEPAAYGLPVIFGPKHDKFWEAGALIRMGGAYAVSDANDLDRQLRKLDDSNSAYANACAASREFIESNRGASEQIAELLHRQLTG